MRPAIHSILTLALLTSVAACTTAGSEEPVSDADANTTLGGSDKAKASKTGGAATSATTGGDPSTATDPGQADGTGPAPNTGGEADEPLPPAGPPKPATEVLLEAVLVTMSDDQGGTWFCSGTLISKDTVVTAGHCLEQGRFRNYKITAPLADGAPSVAGTQPLPMSNEFEAVENPDLGFLKLKTPIELPAYGVLTDISKDVGAGKKFTAAAVVREEEKPISPLHEVNGLAVKSTVADGYAHGFGVTLFSNGGDSGSGLFLVENGHVTHKMIGVARQPDFDADVDHLTRIDPDVLAWLETNGAL